MQDQQSPPRLKMCHQCGSLAESFGVLARSPQPPHRPQEISAERAMSTGPPCPIPTCSSLSRLNPNYSLKSPRQLFPSDPQSQTQPFLDCVSHSSPDLSPAPSMAIWHPSVYPGCDGSGTAPLPHILRAPNASKPEPKNTAQGPERACRAGNGVCTVKHRRAATSNRNGMFAPAIPDPKGSGDQPRARQAAELTGGGGTARSPMQMACRGQGEREEHEHTAPCRFGRARVTTKNRSGKAYSIHQPVLRTQPPKGKEPLWQIKRTINAFFKPGRQDNPIKQMPPRPQLSAQVQLLKLFQGHLRCPRAL